LHHSLIFYCTVHMGKVQERKIREGTKLLLYIFVIYLNIFLLGGHMRSVQMSQKYCHKKFTNCRDVARCAKYNNYAII